MKKIALLGWVGFLVSVATATASDEYKDELVSAMLANAETILEAKKLVQSGRPYVGETHHQVVSDSNPTRVEEFVLDINTSYGDVLARVATLTITKTTTRRGRAPSVEYETRLVPFQTK